MARSRWPGPGGPVPVTRSWWPGPRWPGPVARNRWPAHFCRGPVARSRSRSRPRSLPSVLPMVWFWWPGGPVPVPAPVPVPVSFGGGGPVPVPVPVLAPGRVPVPIKRITYAVRPASSNLFQENGGSTLFSKPLVRGKQYCEVGTIIEQKQEPNGCQSQLLDIKTLDVASWAAVSVCSRNTNVTMVWAWMLS